jgi:catechol 2,3-dioxygenase-like lactoylglutathione lyase family enzyme
VAASLSHLFLHVTSLGRARAFYVDGLGLALLVGSGEDGSGYMRLGGGDGFTIGVEERPPAEVGALGIEIVVRVDDVDATYRRLQAAGVFFESAPADQEWGMRHAWLRDADGYRVSIYSPNTGTSGVGAG